MKKSRLATSQKNGSIFVLSKSGKVPVFLPKKIHICTYITKRKKIFRCGGQGGGSILSPALYDLEIPHI